MAERRLPTFLTRQKNTRSIYHPEKTRAWPPETYFAKEARASVRPGVKEARGHYPFLETQKQPKGIVHWGKHPLEMHQIRSGRCVEERQHRLHPPGRRLYHFQSTPVLRRETRLLATGIRRAEGV